MTEVWQPPDYQPVMFRAGYTDWLCPRCGTVVTDFIAHNRHHKALDDLRNAIVAISQILAPNLPPGMMLTPQTNVKINFVSANRDTEEEGVPQ